jgi:hypothetical protein
MRWQKQTYNPCLASVENAHAADRASTRRGFEE